MSLPGFVSTRSAGEPVSFAYAMQKGLAADGGLYVPTKIPEFPISAWSSSSSLPETGAAILNAWLPESIEALRGLTEDALSFPIPLVPLKGEGWDDIFVLELFHGPTLSFKDVGARSMARLLRQTRSGEDRPLTILVATSGDTGSAVADGFAGQEGIEVVLLYPLGRVSPTQEQQLIARRPGVTTLAIKGSFDDCQALVKQAFVDPALQGLGLSSANSINIGRLLPQSIYYAWAVAQLGQAPALVCVPSGNLGNLTAGVLAHRGGLPISRFLAAHNRNEVFPRYLASGEMHYQPSLVTPSSAMDVGTPSNFERLRHILSIDEMQQLIAGDSIDDNQTLAEIKRVWQETGYLADPHTAVGLASVRQFRAQTGLHGPAIVLATAHPAKFPEIIARALGETPSVPPALAQFERMPQSMEEMEPSYATFRSFLLDRS